MQAERWKQVEALFEAALQRHADQRGAFLRQSCPSDPELCAEVESLLKAAGSRDTLLDGSPLSSIAERPPALKPGDKVGNFEIVALIGRGGMGEVYRARDLRLKRGVALKTLPPDFAADRDRTARFEREARAASALNHPNIVSVFDVGYEGGVSFIISELVEGETLARVIQRGSLPLRKLVEVSTQICDGLAAAHAAGVIHRDLKPGNIMLTRDGRVKLLDFGLARQNNPPGTESATIDASHPGMIMGTPGYMSPEQVRGEPTDARSDLFSFGVVLYEMASGKPAFRGASSVEVMNSVLKDDPPELTPASPPALDRIVRRCIEKRPARRFQSAADLGFALQSLSLSPKPEELPVHRAWLKWAAVAAIALTAGAAYWLGVRPPKPSAPPETTLRRLTNDSGDTEGAAISSDGKLVAYASDRDNPESPDIWLQQIDGSGLIRITDGPAANTDPAFSPDGTQVAFRSEREGGGIYIAPSIGGEARELVPLGRRPRFSPDGRWLMYYTGPSTIGDWRDTKLFVRPVSGGAATEIGAGIGAKCGVEQFTAVWSPDGSRILFLAQCVDEQELTAWVSTVGRGDSTSKSEFHHPDFGDAVIYQWIADPPRLLTRETAGDASYVMAVPVSADGTKVTGIPQRVTSVTDNVENVSAALDRRMVLSVSAIRSHIWGLSVDSNGHPTGPPKQLTYGSAWETTPALSRDGGKLAFISGRAGKLRLFYKDLAIGREKELSTGGANYTGPVFSPNGTGIMCAQWPDPAGWRAFLTYASLSGSLPKKIWDNSFASTPEDWSPDGKTLLFEARDDYSSKRPRWGMIRQLDLESLSTTTFLTDPELDLWQGHFSHDGRWVTFNATNASTPDSSAIYVAPFRKALLPRSEWIPITHGNWDDKPRFSHDDRLVMFLSGNADRPRRIMAQRLTPDMRPTGNPVAVYPPTDSRPSLKIAWDDIGVGPRIIVFAQAESTGNIWLMEPAKAGVK
jgi:eukaryotic-like serine/threonine-protein kinase